VTVRIRPAIWVLVLATASGCSQGLDRGGEALRTPPRSTAAAPGPTPTGSSGSTDARGGVRVERPQPDAEIFSPALVRGTATTTSGQVAIRILDEDGTELAAANVEVSCGADCRGAFETQLAFFVPSRRRGTVQVFEPDPDGRIRRLVEVPVTLIPGV
jgi:hypothetical protein